MTTTRLIPVALLVLSLAACAAGSEPVGAGEGLEAGEGTLHFNADFTTRLEGSLIAGGIAHIDYAPSRARCQLTRGGSPLWSVTAHYRINGGDIHSIHVAGHAPSPDSANLPIELHDAGDLELWFENTASDGCHEWDSALGANYHFLVQVPASDDEARAIFSADSTFRIEGRVENGHVLHIEYATSRLPTCRDTRYGLPAWSILAWYRYPSGRTGYLSVTNGTGELELTESGELQLWFENQGYRGCRAYDSRYGENYRVIVDDNARAPGWIGNGASVINRMTCGDGGPCDANRVPLENGWTYETYARQRAAIRGVYFDVWKAGVTDHDNPNLWSELDVQVHFRFRSGGAFQTRYVQFLRRVGNDARYQVSLRDIDPLASPYAITDASQCPDADLRLEPDNVYVSTTIEYYFTVNGTPYRRASGENFTGVYSNYREQWNVCLPAAPAAE